jgi:hypothetical protein
LGRLTAFESGVSCNESVENFLGSDSHIAKAQIFAITPNETLQTVE